MAKKYKIRKSFADIEPHEVFWDKMAQSKEEELGITEKKFEVPLKERISYILFGFFFLFTVILFAKTFYLQIVNGKEMQIAAENNKGAASIIVPDRGIIYDRNFEKLVSNSPAFDLICDRAQFSFSSEEISKKIDEMASITKQDTQELSSKIQNSKDSHVLIAENIDRQSLLALEPKMNTLTGCNILQNTKRNYLYGPSFSQIIGYTSRINQQEYSVSEGYAINDYIGKIGLEKYYELYLRGTPGQSKVIKTAKGTQVSKEVISEPVSGNNLILNIDAKLQAEVYRALESSIKNLGAKNGAAVAINPKNGAVLALVSYPSYDANLFSNRISQEDYSKLESTEALFNRAIAAQYPTGSTIKPFEASGALQEKLISPDKQINDIGYIEVKSKYDPSVVYRYGGVTPHGWVDMREAIAVSSNIYFYTVGGGYGDQKGLGPKNIKKYLNLFGWGEKTGIDLPGEFQGLVPTPEWKQQNIGEQWWDGDTYNLSIGQSYLKVTPLQVAVAYSAIANGGTLYKPQIVNRIVNSLDSADEPLKSFMPEVIRSNFIDSENLDIVREGMYDCVHQSYGSAVSLNNIGVDIAAKTGTAEIGREGFYNAWIATFAPYDDPEIVFVATIESVDGLRSATLPVARDVLDWYFNKNKGKE